MVILNQEIMITHPLKFLIVAYGYRNPFYIEWVSYHAIFDFSLACEILKSGSNLYHRVMFLVPVQTVQKVQTCTTEINTTREASHPAYPTYVLVVGTFTDLP